MLVNDMSDPSKVNHLLAHEHNATTQLRDCCTATAISRGGSVGAATVARGCWRGGVRLDSTQQPLKQFRSLLTPHRLTTRLSRHKLGQQRCLAVATAAATAVARLEQFAPTLLHCGHKPVDKLTAHKAVGVLFTEMATCLRDEAAMLIHTRHQLVQMRSETALTLCHLAYYEDALVDVLVRHCLLTLREH